MDIIVSNPSKPAYWVEVQRQAALRKGLRIVQRKHKAMPKSSIYEQYVLDALHVVKAAAIEAGLGDDADRYLEFKATCAKKLGLPELVEMQEREIAILSEEAVAETIAVMEEGPVRTEYEDGLIEYNYVFETEDGIDYAGAVLAESPAKAREKLAGMFPEAVAVAGELQDIEGRKWPISW